MLNDTQHKNSQKGFSAVELLVILILIGIVGLVGWQLWQSRNDQSATTGSNQQAQSSTSEPLQNNDIGAQSVQENAQIEYEAVLAKAAQRCGSVSGNSVALGTVDEEISLSEQEAEQRCKEAANKGNFASPRIELLLKKKGEIAD